MNILDFFRPKQQLSPPLSEVIPSLLVASLTKTLKSLPNPDEVLKYQGGGKGPKLYRDMLDKDPDLRATVERRVNTVAGKPWEVMPFDESDAATAQAEFVSGALDMLPNFTDVRRRILAATAFGFSVNEPIWAIGDDGMVYLVDVKDKPNELFAFAIDDQRLLYRKSAFDMDYTDVPPHKSILCQYQATGDNPYGSALMKSVYFYYWFKINAMRFWAIATEKYGMPSVIGQLPANVTEAAREQFIEDLNNITKSTAMAISTDVASIKLLEAIRPVADPFAAFIRYIEEKYSWLILGGTFTGGQTNASGSRASEQVHADATDDIVQYDAEMLMAVIQRDIIKPLIDFNFPPNAVLGYPTFNIKFEPEKDRLAIVEVMTKAVAVGLEIPQSWAYEQLNIPMPIDGEPVLIAPVPPTAPGGGDPAQDNQLSLRADLPTVMGLIKDFRENNLSAVLQHLSTGNPHAATTLSGDSHIPPNVRLAAEDPEQYLPGLPPLPEPVEGQPMPKQPDAKMDRYQIGALANRQVIARRELRRIYGSLVNNIIAEFGQSPDEIFNVLDEMIESKFKRQLRAPLSAANREAIRQAAREMATQLGMSFNAPLFTDLTQSYLRVHAYESGVIDGIGETVRQTLSGELRTALLSGDDLNGMVTALKAKLPGIAEWQAERVAITETRAAANWSVLEMGIRSRMDLESWFITDPESCIQCQELAAGNPYPLQWAQGKLLPHPSCNDYWALTKRGGR